MTCFEEIRKAMIEDLSLEEQKRLLIELRKIVEQGAESESERECAARLHELLPFISEIFKVSQGCILTRDRRRPVVECRNALMLRLYRDGFPIRSIAGAMGLSRSTVTYSIEEASGAISSRNPSWVSFIQKWRTFNEYVDLIH